MARDKSKARPAATVPKPRKKPQSRKGRRSVDFEFFQEERGFSGGSKYGGEQILSVVTNFGVFTFAYDPPIVRKLVKDQFQHLIDLLVLGDAFTKLPEELMSAVIDEVVGKRRDLYMDRKLQSLLDQTSEHAYQTFLKKFPSRMKFLPQLLVEQLVFTFLSVCGEREMFISKSQGRQAWRDFVRHYEQRFKKEWIELKPGPVEKTSRESRAKMLASYYSVLGVCQSAKALYKRSRGGDWRSVVKQNHGELDSDDIENLVRLKPSEVARFMVGKRFNRILGADLGGEEELRRQLRKARKEAAENTN